MMDKQGSAEGRRGFSDEELVRRIQNGERELLQELAERFLPAVYNRLVRMAPPSDVDDLTQEVMLAIVRSVDRFGGRSSVLTWVHAIANNKLKYYYRQRRHYLSRPRGGEVAEGDADVQTLPDKGDEPLKRIMEADERGAVARIVNALRPSYQQALRLRFTDEMEFKEIGKAMGLTLDAVKSLFRRAVADVAKRVRRLKQNGRGSLK